MFNPAHVHVKVVSLYGSRIMAKKPSLILTKFLHIHVVLVGSPPPDFSFQFWWSSSGYPMHSRHPYFVPFNSLFFVREVGKYGVPAIVISLKAPRQCCEFCTGRHTIVFESFRCCLGDHSYWTGMEMLQHS